MIELRLLGTVRLTDASGREVKRLLTRSRRLALLAYLAVATPRGLRRRDTLLALFWPELDQEHARAALRQALHVVRGALGADVVVTRGDDEVGLDLEHIWCDVVAFQHAVETEQHDAALDLYQGDLLEGFFIPGAGEFERWLESTRGQLRATASNAARALVERCETAGDLGAAVECARRSTRLGLHDEEILRRLIALLDRLGNRAGAVQAYEEFAQQLKMDLETEPSAETKAVLAEVQARKTAMPRNVRTPEVTAPSRRRSQWWPSVLAATAAGLVFSSPGAGRGRAAPKSIEVRVQSLAVLPFQNLSSDTLGSWYADGLAEALTTDLGRIQGLSVIAPRAVTPLRASQTPLQSIAHELRVDALIEGGVQQSGGRVRADIRLISAATGYQLWADRFEEPTQNRFVLEDRVARAIVSALELRLSGSEEHVLHALPTVSVEAYDAYRRGKLRLRRENRTDDSVAITWFERAVALDPGFAAAHAALGHAYELRVAQFAPGDSATLERAFLEVEKALHLNPDLAEAHYARAGLLWGATKLFAHDRAIEEDRRALELNANLSEAHHHLGLIYLHIGLLDQAVAEFQRTLTLNPFDANAQRRIGIVQIYRGQYADGYATFRRVGPEANPALWTYQIAWALLYLGRDAEAAARMEEYLRVHPEDRGGVVRSTRAILRAKTGDAAGAIEDIGRAVKSGKGFVHFHHTAYNIASVYALLREPTRAVYWLRQAADDGWPCYPYFARDPNLDHIRSDPDFVAFMKQLKRQWERYEAMP